MEHLAEKTVLALFDVKAALSHIHIGSPDTCFDVGIAAYLLNPLKSDYTWQDVAAEHLSLLVDEKIEGDRKTCYEAYTVWAAAAALEEKLKETGTENLFRSIEMPLAFTLFAMEQAGVRIEADALRFYGEQLGAKIVELEKEIYEQAGEEFNINSPKQLGVILFEKLKLPHGKKTKTGYSTAADVLDKLAPEYPVVEKILEYRQLTKLKSTYADGLANYICADGRIHGKFNQTITATGRISSTEPNLQNIPCPYGTWKTDPEGIYPGRWICICRRRLFADRTSHPCTLLGGSGIDPCLPGGKRHSPDHSLPGIPYTV